MSSISESGHAKNIARFEDLITVCQQFGPIYNPANGLIQLTTLQAKLTAAKAALLDAVNTKTTYNNATNAREIAFTNLRKLVTRIVNALDAGGAAQQTIDDAKVLQRKMNGRRAGIKPVVAETAREATPTAPEAGTATATRSVSQQSYDQLLHHFNQLISLLASEPTYAPNEADLQVATLQALYISLETGMTQVMAAEAAYDIARLNRDSALRNSISGIVSLGQQAKKYVKSLFGASSTQYKLVSTIYFH